MHCAGILHRANVGAEHAVEVTGLGEVTRGAAVGAHDVSESTGRLLAVLLGIGLQQLIGTPAPVALLALGERIHEGIDVPGRLPDLRSKDDRGVDADNIVAAAHDGLPPLATDVLLQLDSQGAVVPR